MTTTQDKHDQTAAIVTKIYKGLNKTNNGRKTDKEIEPSKSVEDKKDNRPRIEENPAKRKVRKIN